MKKLMVIAAAASLAAAAEAAIVVNTNCQRSVGCPVVAFKVTGSGKIAAAAEKKGDVYKTTTKLSIKKGALVLFPVTPSWAVSPDDCCYNNYSLYLQVKINKETYPVGVFFEPIDSWSIYGKDYEKAILAEKSKKYKVESELGLSYINVANANSSANGGTGGADTVTQDNGLDIDLNLSDFAFFATAFGKGTYAVRQTASYTSCNVCTPGTTTLEFVPSNYSGWFAGMLEAADADFGCLLCDCSSLDVFGGTWKAKYESKWSKRADDWEKAATYVFGAATLDDMLDNDIE